MNAPDPRDYLLYMAAASDDRLQAVAARLDAIAAESGLAELTELRHLVQHVRHILQQSAVPFSPAGLDHEAYSDGRRVTSIADLEPPTYHRHVWHPDPAHHENQPHAAVDHFRFPSGSAWSVIVSAPGVLDAVCHTEGG
ncbi:hypothetical protein [Mycolicibacter virginiensis]|uniref:hypothetical protein n=1 Tax=Mycolicibacter virginiensis TaxID=1795032 RepID=UPI001F0395E6|nr:hypothetical protein [Mycolicibacter virginiensis]ULP45943.1 hypothetical protein MJO54_13815 [Mycolicibacter virginiensis]